MLSTEGFKVFAKEVVPFLHVTSYVEGAKHADLLSEKGGEGFPYVVAMDDQGLVTAIFSHVDLSVDGFRSMVKEGKEYAEKKARKDLALDDRLELFRFDMRVGNLTVEEARKAIAGMKGLSEDQRKGLEDGVLTLEIRAHMPKSDAPEAAREAGKTFAEMWKAGKEPKGDDIRIFQTFYILIMDHAEEAKDADLFVKAMKKLKERFGERPEASGFFEKQDKRLAKLKEDAGKPRDK